MEPLPAHESEAAGTLPELTPEQWAAGKEIAELIGLDDETLGKTMSWNGVEARVDYGLAHSAHYMDHLTASEIRRAVFDGIAAYQKTQGNASGAR